tara:strand:+ start:5347 stop:5856 length:510 start_codon:yes stop_codon:yes gene_type:complete
MKKAAASQRTQFIMMFFAFAFGMILSNLLNTQSLESESNDGQEILFIYRGIEKTQAEMFEHDRYQINELNQQKIKLIETAALKQYFLDEAKKQSLDVEEVAKNILKWEPVSEAEINSFFEQNKHRIKKQFHEVKKHIKQNLELQRANSARRHLLDELIQAGDLAILPRR